MHEVGAKRCIMSENWREEVLHATGIIEEISPEALAEKLDEFCLVDVREVHEHAQGMMEGAIALPLSEFKEKVAQVVPKDRQVVFYCAGGVRSLVAALWAKEIIHLDGLSLKGGYKAWAKS